MGRRPGVCRPVLRVLGERGRPARGLAQGADGALWHIWQTAAGGGWGGWASRGGQLTSKVSVGRNRDGRVEVFVRGTDGALWHQWQLSAGGGWSSLGGGLVGQPVIGSTDRAEPSAGVGARGAGARLT